ncbi:hypothetical protein Tco_0737490 [Tanacetum coccineum]
MYVSGRIDIFDMVDIDLFTIVALNMMVLKLGYAGKFEPMFYNYLRPLTSLDKGLYTLACEEDIRCLATLVRSFKLIEVYIKHGVTALDSYLRAPRFRATLEEITDEFGNIAETKLKNVVGFDTQSHVLLTIQSQFSDINLSFVLQQTTASHVIDDLMRQLSFDKTKLDGEIGFANVVGSDVGRTQEPILAEVSTQEPIMAEVNTQEPIVAEVSTEVPIVEESSKDACINDDDDVDEVFLVDEENEIVEPDVDVHLFGISMDLPFDNIGVTNLVPDDVLKGEDVDVINADGFDSDPGTGPTDSNRRMEAGPSGLSGPSTRSKKRKNTCTNDDSQASSVLDAYDKGDLYPWVLYVGKDKFTKKWVVKTYNDTHTCLQSRKIKHCTYKFLYEKIFKQVSINPDIPVKAVQDQLQRELEVQISMSIAFRAKATAEREIRGDHVLQYSMLRDDVVELQSTNPNTTAKITIERNTDPSLPTRVFQRIYVCLGALKLGFRACKRYLLGLDGAFMKGPFPGQVLVAIGLDSNNGIYPLAYALVEAEKHRYCLRHIHENMKHGWYEQAYKDLLWRATSTTNVRSFEKCRAKSDLLLNNIYEVFNGKIVRGRDKLVITLLEYIREYCMKRIVNVQDVIDKCTGPLTPTATRIMEPIKKEAHLMKVKWNGANKHQVSGSLGDQYVVDVVSGTTHRNIESSGSASRQAQQTEPAVGQDGSGGSGAGAVIGLSAVAGEGGAGVSMSETRNANGREMGDGVPTQSSAAGGASEWSFL